MIRLRKVTKSYAGRRILDSVSLEFEQNAVYVLRGPSGTGKSTLMNIVAGYVHPDAGIVERGERVGYLMQDELLFSKLRVSEMLYLRYLGLLSTGVYDRVEPFWDDADRWLEGFGLSQFRESEVGTLSGGERRRLEIASIMLADPGLLMMDEPTSGLDPENARTVYSAVWRVREHRAVIIATHETSIPCLPDSARELSLDCGKVREHVVAGTNDPP